jgi:hypothetical protein
MAATIALIGKSLYFSFSAKEEKAPLLILKENSALIVRKFTPLAKNRPFR